jgi:hypothetical protein
MQLFLDDLRLRSFGKLFLDDLRLRHVSENYFLMIFQKHVVNEDNQEVSCIRLCVSIK